MSLAVIRVLGKQYLVSPGDIITVDGNLKKSNNLDQLIDVLLYANEKSLLLGKPVLEKVKVKPVVIGDLKEKITVEKFKPKVRYRRKIGSVKRATQIKIESISLLK